MEEQQFHLPSTSGSHTGQIGTKSMAQEICHEDWSHCHEGDSAVEISTYTLIQVLSGEALLIHVFANPLGMVDIIPIEFLKYISDTRAA